MIKKVKVQDLEVGVYVHDFNCEWKGENLYIEKSHIKSNDIIDILVSWGIKEVYIDTEKGLDINESKATYEPKKKNENDLSSFDTTRDYQRPQVPLNKELQPAFKITQEAVKLVKQINDTILKGKPPEVGPSYELAIKMKESINRNRDALLLLTKIRNKDEYTLYHSISVSSLVINMCNYYGKPEQQTIDLAVGALFHDIGKAVVPERILNKPGKLTPSEYKEIQKHTEHSVTLLQDSKDLPLECYDMALHHHERYDGKGYPTGLAGDQISFGSQLACICDVFDAMTSDRCYKIGVDSVTGLKTIYDLQNSFFGKELTYDFIRCIGVYPIGTCVVLKDGRSGFVVGSTDDIVRPVVQLFYDEKKEQRIKPHKVNLAKTGDSIAGYGNPDKFGVTSQLLLKTLIPKL